MGPEKDAWNNEHQLDDGDLLQPCLQREFGTDKRLDSAVASKLAGKHALDLADIAQPVSHNGSADGAIKNPNFELDHAPPPTASVPLNDSNISDQSSRPEQSDASGDAGVIHVATDAPPGKEHSRNWHKCIFH